jgi:hypothetical protein
MFKNMTKTKLIYYGVFVSLLGILIGSVSHLSYTFFTLEEKESLGFVSFTISAGIEAGMLAIAFGIAERRRSGRQIIDLLFYQIFFAAVNFYGNLYFAISVFTGQRNLTVEHIVAVDPLILFTACFLSGSLPILALSLSELQSIFGLRVKQEDKIEQKRIEKEKQEKIKEERRELKKKEREEFLKAYSGKDKEILSKHLQQMDDRDSEEEEIEDIEEFDLNTIKEAPAPQKNSSEKTEDEKREIRRKRREDRIQRRKAQQTTENEELKKNSLEEKKQDRNNEVGKRTEDPTTKLVENLTSGGDFKSEALKQFPVDVFDSENRRRIPLKED